MPFPNYHSARLKDPDQFEKFSYDKNKLGKGVDVVYGIKDGKAVLQAIRFNKSFFTYDEVKKWLKSHSEYTVIKVEKSEDIKEETVSGDIEKPTPPMGKVTKRINKFKEFIKTPKEKYRVHIYSGNYKDFDDYDDAYSYYVQMEKSGDDPKKPIKVQL